MEDGIRETSQPEFELGTPASAAGILSLDHQSKRPMIQINITSIQNYQGLSFLPVTFTALQIILDLCIPEKELAKTRSQMSFI